MASRLRSVAKEELRLKFPCRLGPDVRGIASGPDYPRFLRAGYDNNKGTGWVVDSPKSGRMMDALSGIERAAMYMALIDPQVLDIREQYPAYDVNRLAKYLEDPARRIPRSIVPNLDLLLTRLDSRAPGGFSYEAVFVKGSLKLGNIEVQDRIDREIDFCDGLGWSWSLFTEKHAAMRGLQASREICLMAKHIDLDSIRGECEDAAPRIVARADGRSLRAVVGSLARSLRIEPARASGLIAGAALHGFLTVDVTKPIENGFPLCVLA